jgi:solute carrier family 25 (mitochondrial carnitine/acylcarnitine transporter), member 20/29
MLGSLTFYRRLLLENVFTSPTVFALDPFVRSRTGVVDKSSPAQLPALGHAIAGVMAGWTVSLVAAPVEHIKARLQIQYAADKSKRLYSGPIDCTRKIVRTRMRSNHVPN